MSRQKYETLFSHFGSKSKLLDKFKLMFPNPNTYDIFVEPFAGSLTVSMNLINAPYMLINEPNKDIQNVIKVMQLYPAKLHKKLQRYALCSSLLKEFRKEKQPKNIIERAARFLYLKNYTFLGSGETLKIEIGNKKQLLLQKLKRYEKFFANQNVTFTDLDFRSFLGSIALDRLENNYSRIFIYFDPPYYNTHNGYGFAWNLSDSEDVFKIAKEFADKGAKIAISEFDSVEICGLAEKYGFKKEFVMARRNVNDNTCNEYLFVNYKINTNEVVKQNMLW